MFIGSWYDTDNPTPEEAIEENLKQPFHMW
jgi:hypothetical protein